MKMKTKHAGSLFFVADTQVKLDVSLRRGSQRRCVGHRTKAGFYLQVNEEERDTANGVSYLRPTWGSAIPRR